MLHYMTSGPPLKPSTATEIGRLTLGAGDAGSVASSSFGAAEVSSVVQAVGQGHLGTGAADAAHHHSVGTHLSWPIPRLLLRGHDPRFTAECHPPLI